MTTHLRRAGGRIRIAAELIRVQDQTQLLADVYEREMSGMLALQGDVGRCIAGALALKLLPVEQSRLANVHTVKPEAYEACLKSWIAWTSSRLSYTVPNAAGARDHA